MVNAKLSTIFTLHSFNHIHDDRFKDHLINSISLVYPHDDVNNYVCVIGEFVVMVKIRRSSFENDNLYCNCISFFSYTQ